jgi:hypothetical protein
MSDQPALMDLARTAEYLETSTRTVERQTAGGKMPGFRKLFGTQSRWSRAVLDAWIVAGCPPDAEAFEEMFRQAPPPSAKSEQGIAITGATTRIEKSNAVEKSR